MYVVGLSNTPEVSNNSLFQSSVLSFESLPHVQVERCTVVKISSRRSFSSERDKYELQHSEDVASSIRLLHSVQCRILTSTLLINHMILYSMYCPHCQKHIPKHITFEKCSPECNAPP
jgi:hypothetical protein